MREGRVRRKCGPVVIRAVIVSLLVLVPAFALMVTAQTIRYSRRVDVGNGKRVYNTGCNSCHGADGRGAPEKVTEFERHESFPDFTRCDQTSAEPDMNWKAVIVYGGPYRSISQIMPAFREVLTDDEINDVVAYLRTFCKENNWPRGELNLPRALVTEKAFPEDEVVLSSEINASGAPGFSMDVIHEQRFGKKNQFEIDVPIEFQNNNHKWDKGFGDVTFGYKRVLWSSLPKGGILSAQAGLLAPFGNDRLGFGAGTPTLETFAAYDQLFKTNTFLQFQVGNSLTFDREKAPRSMFYRAVVGQTIAGDNRLGRMWSPMVEFLADRDFATGAKTNWDVLPQMQVTLSRRQHVRANIGVRTPMTNREGRNPSVVFYLLWDWADAKLWEGW